MGWLYMPRASLGLHTSAKAYLDAQFTYEREQEGGGTKGLRVLASSCPQNRVYYAATQVMTNGIGGEVFAIICLVRWNPADKEGLIFGYKNMEESMGPLEDGCPEAILDLLTATMSEYALGWRTRCRARLALHRRPLNHGDRIKLDQALTFTDGHIADEFIVEKRGRRLAFRDPVTHGLYRISRFKDRLWSIVPVTNVHKTLFA